MNVYLDYAATTPLDEKVLQEMLPFFTDNFGNPDSLHEYGRRAAYAVTQARDKIASILGVSPSEVYFTSGGTEADNWAVKKLAKHDKQGVCYSAIEHAAVQSAAETCEHKSIALANRDGIVTKEAVEAAIDEKTGLVCCMAVNNETGCIQPLEEISELCKKKGIVLFSDCVQASTVCDLRALLSVCDAISLSGHKIYGPKGIGVLVVKRGISLSPLISGGEQERGLRGGTLNPAAIVGFARALELAQSARQDFDAHARSLQTYFEKTLRVELGANVTVDGVNRVPNISHLTFKGGETLLNRLDLCGVACSGGAACSAHAGLPSHVMLSMGRTEEEARCGIRFSFGKQTTRDDVAYAIEQIIECFA